MSLAIALTVAAAIEAKPLEVFHSERITDAPTLSVAPRRARAVRRARLREIVPSGAWYEQATTDKGVKFPVPGMVESEAATWFPASYNEPTSKASRRMMSPFADEDRFDLLTYWEANQLRLPPAWSMQLVAGMRPRRDLWQFDPLKREPTLRSVKLGLMTKWEWTQHTAHGPVVRSTVKCRWGLGRQRCGPRDRLRRLWPIDEVPVVDSEQPKEATHVTDGTVS